MELTDSRRPENGPVVAAVAGAVASAAGIGRNRSRVKSKISEPMAPIADAYRSRRTRDSFTTNSANKRTRSASEVDAASCWAKALKRPIVPAENCSAVWFTAISFVYVSREELAANCEEEEDRLWGGGVGRALGTAAVALVGVAWRRRDLLLPGTAGYGEKGGVAAPALRRPLPLAPPVIVSPVRGEASRCCCRLMSARPLLGPPPPLRGVDFVMVGRRMRLPTDPADGIIMLDSVRPWPWPCPWLCGCVSTACDMSIEFLALPIRVRLSVRRSRSVFSPRTAPARPRTLFVPTMLPLPVMFASGECELCVESVELAESPRSRELVALDVLLSRDSRLGELSSRLGRPSALACCRSLVSCRGVLALLLVLLLLVVLSTVVLSGCAWVWSMSNQPAGVGGTGPRTVTPAGGGRRVGGAMAGSPGLATPGALLVLADRELEGGGPGGGGGKGKPDSQRTCDEDRERVAEVGVVMAPVEAARRDPGATFCGAAGICRGGRPACCCRKWCC